MKSYYTKADKVVIRLFVVLALVSLWIWIEGLIVAYGRVENLIAVIGRIF